MDTRLEIEESAIHKWLKKTLVIFRKPKSQHWSKLSSVQDQLKYDYANYQGLLKEKASNETDLIKNK